MNKIKLFISLLILAVFAFTFADKSYAAPVSIRLQSPVAQTNQNNVTLTFVAQDMQNRVVAVQCYKKGPSDGSFVAFGSVINLSAGGNTDNCQVDSGVLNSSGNNYQFKAVATAGSDSADSNIVSLDFSSGVNPQSPQNYSKSEQDNCTYKITFKTADDNGKTVKVFLYRSTELNFDLDGAHKVSEMNINSNTEGSFTNGVSDCNINYYYAIRSFDAYGNGSSGVGDSGSSITTVNPTGTTPQGQQALLAAAGSSINQEATKGVLGTESANQEASGDKKVTTVSNPISDSLNWVATHKKISLFILFVLAVLAYFLYRRYYKKIK